MTNTFFISDTHFGHTNAWQKFKREDGTPLRPFKSTEEMDETMINNWNSVVGPKDRVYHLGDFCMARKNLSVFQRLQGRICLVLGNHDPWKRADYDKYAPNIDVFQGAKMLPKLGWVCTHIPVYGDMLGHPRGDENARWVCNIHGHLHYKKVMEPEMFPYRAGLPDERYFNVSVECIDYTPIAIEELKKRVPHR
jgi:calcineurin-like phosphoesterase family protein